MKKINVLLTIFVALTMVLASCAPAQTPTVTAPTTAPVQATQPPANQGAATTAPVATSAPTEMQPTQPQLPVATIPSGTGPAKQPNLTGTLNFVMVQHALCAWDSFWCTVEQGIKDAAKQMNVNVTILGPDKFDLEKTAALIDQATASKPDGIGLTVTD
ncbi:MAG TPA: hypothetical protein VGK09_11155, partial [Rhodocyclaceae bacterium]